MQPLRFSPRASRAEIDSEGAELGRARRLRRAGVDVHTCGDLKVHESGGDDRRPKLCFLQSAGNSALPEVDVAFGFVAEGFLDENITDLKTAARLEHTRYFLQGAQFVGEQIEDAIRDHDVRPRVGCRQ